MDTILHRQKLFVSTLKSYCLRKITKYQNILLKNGIHLSEQSYNTDDTLALPRSQSFEDHIELLIGRKSASPNAYKTFWKIGNRISTTKLFRWIYSVVQRTKAARILNHLDGISDSEIQTVIMSVGWEIAVAFEYQLYLLDGDLEIIKLAQHTGACIITYLNSKEAHFAPENLLQAVIEIKPQSSSNKEILRTRTTQFNNESVCLRWRLSQVLKQAGLRIIPGDLVEVINEKPSLTKGNKQSDDSDENVDESLLCTPCKHTETEQSINVEQDEYETTATEDTENGKTTSDKSWKEKSEIDVCTNEDDSLIDAANTKRRKHRRISAVDMDFEKGVMKVTDYSVEVSDFSPIGNDTSQIHDSDSTSIDEDMDSEGDNSEFAVGDDKSNINIVSSNISVHENGKQTGKNGVNSLKNMGSDENSGDKWVNKKGSELDDTAINEHVNKKNEEPNISLDSNASNNENNYSNSNILDQSGAVCSEIYTTEDVSENEKHTVDNRIAVSVTDAGSPQLVHIKQDTHSQVTYESLQDLNDKEGIQADKTEIHIHSNNHIKDTYQSSQKPATANISNETVDKICDIMPDLASDDKPYIFYGCFTPYGAKCRPEIYGYRGPLHVWNEMERCHTLIYNDQVTVTRNNQRQIKENPQDLHQLYRPMTVYRH